MRKKTTGAKEKRRERKEKKNGRKTRKGKNEKISKHGNF
jgi:hypothetical protein